MEACATSQFEQHVRAICNLPLGETKLRTPVVMVNVLGEHMDGVVQTVVNGGDTGFHVIPKVHLYGKNGSAPKRKMGHINLLCDNVEEGLDWIQKNNIWRNQHL
ncbi:N5-carboxyaminoimidazole ribonucleotide synthase [compost metagenome]